MLEFRKKAMRDIIIQPVAHGFIVKCGCCTAAFSKKEEVISAITEYLNDSDAVEGRYNEATCATGALVEETETLATNRSSAAHGVDPVNVPIEQMNQELRRRSPRPGVRDEMRNENEDCGGNCVR